MTHKTVLSQKGEVFIPNYILEALNLKPGSRIVVSAEGNGVLIRPVSKK